MVIITEFLSNETKSYTNVMNKQKVLNGQEVAEYIKERQARQVAGLNKTPCLAIVRTNDDQVTDLYLRIKQRYANDIGVDVKVLKSTEVDSENIIKKLNQDPTIDGIIIQLPLADQTKTDVLLNMVSQSKDVDGLAKSSEFDPPTPLGILWLLSAYNIELSGKSILVVGQGRLVGLPLTKLLGSSGYKVLTADESTKDLKSICLDSDIIISAVGKSGLIRADMIKAGAVIIDSGTSSEGGAVVGDVAEDVRKLPNIAITPIKGGVGPMTVAALFENLIQATIKHQQ